MLLRRLGLRGHFVRRRVERLGGGGFGQGGLLLGGGQLLVRQGLLSGRGVLDGLLRHDGRGQRLLRSGHGLGVEQLRDCLRLGHGLRLRHGLHLRRGLRVRSLRLSHGVHGVAGRDLGVRVRNLGRGVQHVFGLDGELRALLRELRLWRARGALHARLRRLVPRRRLGGRRLLRGLRVRHRLGRHHLVLHDNLFLHNHLVLDGGRLVRNGGLLVLRGRLPLQGRLVLRSRLLLHCRDGLRLRRQFGRHLRRRPGGRSRTVEHLGGLGHRERARVGGRGIQGAVQRVQGLGIVYGLGDLGREHLPPHGGGGRRRRRRTRCLPASRDDRFCSRPVPGHGSTGRAPHRRRSGRHRFHACRSLRKPGGQRGRHRYGHPGRRGPRCGLRVLRHVKVLRAHRGRPGLANRAGRDRGTGGAAVGEGADRAGGAARGRRAEMQRAAGHRRLRHGRGDRRTAGP
nr:hypothetical protein [Streptomyces sp. KM273126]